MNENKKQMKSKNQSRNGKRDGVTGDRITWAGKVDAVFQRFGTGDQAKWFTHAAIKRALGVAPDNLAQVLYDMVKAGYLERAEKPLQVRSKHAPRREYIYRRTRKAFKATRQPSKEIERGFQLRLEHARLPKWFRDMMQ